MTNAPEIFFDYKIDNNAKVLNAGDEFVIYSFPCNQCPPPCKRIENNVNTAFLTKLVKINPIAAKRLIDYHYHAYKGDKRDFITGVSILISTQLRSEKKLFPLQHLTYLEGELNKANEADTAPIYNAPNNNIRLTWNGQSNALIDVFRQLKTMVNNKNEPLLVDSYDDIATYLMNSFTNFEHTKRGTILTQLKTNNLVKNTNKRITISCTAPDSDVS